MEPGHRSGFRLAWRTKNVLESPKLRILVIGTVSQHDERVEPVGVFKALADRTRVRILQLLCRQELNVSELVDVLQQPQPTISRNLKVLGTHGLVTARTVGTAAFYSVSADLAKPQGEAGQKS
ncbi:MAG: winged helix-turn-helix transcriptional regulator, partial [Chloroflexi bacterium]|nr:winged helix-turn-helix transcriptional regulator [Chloroflexota bacterium]